MTPDIFFVVVFSPFPLHDNQNNSTKSILRTYGNYRFADVIPYTWSWFLSVQQQWITAYSMSCCQFVDYKIYQRRKAPIVYVETKKTWSGRVDNKENLGNEEIQNLHILRADAIVRVVPPVQTPHTFDCVHAWFNPSVSASHTVKHWPVWRNKIGSLAASFASLGMLLHR